MAEDWSTPSGRAQIALTALAQTGQVSENAARAMVANWGFESMVDPAMSYDSTYIDGAGANGGLASWTGGRFAGVAGHLSRTDADMQFQINYVLQEFAQGQWIPYGLGGPYGDSADAFLKSTKDVDYLIQAYAWNYERGAIYYISQRSTASLLSQKGINLMALSWNTAGIGSGAGADTTPDKPKPKPNPCGIIGNQAHGGTPTAGEVFQNPFKDWGAFTITQAGFQTFYDDHVNAPAWDVSNGQESALVAPFSGVSYNLLDYGPFQNWLTPNVNGGDDIHPTLLISKGPVLLGNGQTKYAWIYTQHGRIPSNYGNIAQGATWAYEGTQGISSGNHSHIQVGYSDNQPDINNFQPMRDPSTGYFILVDTGSGVGDIDEGILTYWSSYQEAEQKSLSSPAKLINWTDADLAQITIAADNVNFDKSHFNHGKGTSTAAQTPAGNNSAPSYLCVAKDDNAAAKFFAMMDGLREQRIGNTGVNF